jgi:preprotein translocase subunit YajC
MTYYIYIRIITVIITHYYLLLLLVLLLLLLYYIIIQPAKKIRRQTMSKHVKTRIVKLFDTPRFTLV